MESVKLRVELERAQSFNEVITQVYNLEAEPIKLKLEVTDDKSLKTITKEISDFSKKIAGFGEKPIAIHFEATGLEALKGVTQEVIDLTKEQVKAQTELTQKQIEARIEEQKTAQAKAAAKQAQYEATAEFQRTARAEQEAAIAEQAATKATEERTRAEIQERMEQYKAAQQLQKTTQEYTKLSIAQEQTKQSSEKTEQAAAKALTTEQERLIALEETKQKELGLAAAKEKTTQAFLNASAAVENATASMLTYQTQVERTITAEVNLAAAAEKTLTALARGASSENQSMNFGEEFTANADRIRQQTSDILSNVQAQRGAASAAAQNTAAQKSFADSLDVARDALNTYKASQTASASANAQAAVTGAAAASAANATTSAAISAASAQQQQASAASGLAQAQAAVYQSMDAATRAVFDQASNLIKDAEAIDTSTKAGQQLQATMMKTAQAMLSALSANQKSREEMAKTARSANEVTIAQEKTRQSVEAKEKALADALREEQKANQEAEKTKRAEKERQQQEEKTRQAIEKTNQEIQRGINKEIELAKAKEDGVNADKRVQLENARTETAYVNASAAVERRIAAEINLQAQQEKTATEEVKLQEEQEKTTRKLTGTTSALYGNADAAAEAQTWWEKLSTTIAKSIVHFAVYSSINAVKTALKDAITTMKEVDDQLVVVRKVTGASTAEMKLLEEQAYKTASAFGVSAQEYLSSVAEFSRAGYKDAAADLAELAVKTQLVGDVTQDVANQFLIATDKAYGYEGSITKLTRVLDGANEIDNKYATSIGKIAEGLGIVAPVAAQANVGIDELTAAIGTITAVTQRSGSETARALRALFLNIVGDTKTEIEEDLTWTAGEIDGLRDILLHYAPEAVKAAQATGELVDPMKAIEGLAMSVKDGVLTSQELFTMVSDIGGKLRASQLTALIENWDMYTSMLEDFSGAMGSADKEVENALTGWTARVNVLKNTWADFVQKSLSTNTIKWFIDALTWIVQGLGNIGTAVTVLGAALVSLNINRWMNSLKFVSDMTKTLGGGLKNLLAVLQNYGAAQRTAAAQGNALTKETLSETVAFNGLGLAVSAVTAALTIGIMLWNHYRQAQQEARDAALEAADAFDSQLESISEAMAVVKDQDSSYSDLETAIKGVCSAYDGELSKINDINVARETAIGLLNDEAKAQAEKTLRELGGQYAKVKDKTEAEDIHVSGGGIFGFNGQLSTAIGLADYYNKLIAEGVKLSKDQADHFNAVSAAVAAGNKTLEENQKIVEQYENAKAIYYGYTEALDKATDSTTTNTDATDDNATASQRLKEKITELSSAAETTKKRMDALSNAQSEFQKYAGLTNDTLTKLEETFPGITGKIFDQEGAIRAEIKAFFALEESVEKAKAAEIIFSNNSLDVSGKIAQLKSLALAAGVTASAINAVTDAISYNNKPAIPARGKSFQAAQDLGGGLDDVDLVAYYNKLMSELETESKASKSSASSASSSSYSAKSATDTVLEGHKDLVDLLKSELSIMEKRGDADTDQISKIKEIQSALHDEADYLRSIGGDQTDINKLSAEWWDYQKKILDLQKQETVVEEELKEIDEERLKLAKERIKAYYEAENAALKAQQDALDKATEAEDDRVKLAEKKLAVEKALLELQNAQNQRTVRQYNAASGSWEWVANQKDVQDKQDAYDKASQEYTDFLRELEVKAQKELLQSQIDTNNAMWDSLEAAVDKFVDALKDGSGDTGKAFTELIKTLKDSNIKSTELYDQIVIALMKANSQAWFSASPEMKEKLHDYNNQLGALIGAKYDSSTGTWYDTNGLPLYSTDGSGVSVSSGGSSGGGGSSCGCSGGSSSGSSGSSSGYITPTESGTYDPGDGENYSVYGPAGSNPYGSKGTEGYYWMNKRLYSTKTGSKASDDTVAIIYELARKYDTDLGVAASMLSANQYQGAHYGEENGTEWNGYGGANGYATYDSGGVLHGLGGIKATSADEVVLPPDITSKLLSPVLDSNMRTRFDELRYLYGGSAKPSSIANNIGTQHNGDDNRYVFGNITLSEAEAKSTTVYELARLSRGLSIYNSRN